MPRLDGFGLLAALRDDARTRTIPVIMLSARAGEDASYDGISAGVDDYLAKPFSAQELIARVTRCLANAHLRRESELRLEVTNGKLHEALQELESIARLDALTGLPNRRTWDLELPATLVRAKRADHAVCVAVLDIDHTSRRSTTPTVIRPAMRCCVRPARRGSKRCARPTSLRASEATRSRCCCPAVRSTSRPRCCSVPAPRRRGTPRARRASPAGTAPRPPRSSSPEPTAPCTARSRPGAARSSRADGRSSIVTNLTGEARSSRADRDVARHELSGGGAYASSSA
jgi:hypothetical protein